MSKQSDKEIVKEPNNFLLSPRFKETDLIT